MTQLMEQVVERLRDLPADEQDRIAGRLMSQLSEDEKWRASTADHEDQLARLVEQIGEEGRRGEHADLDPERL